MRIINPIASILLALLLPSISFSQITYPATATLSISYPITPFLEDLTLPGSHKLNTTLIFNDYNESSWDVSLKITIESPWLKIETSGGYKNTKPIKLIPGIPLNLTGNDLSDYFSSRNLIYQQLNSKSYNAGEALPEGIYTISVEVLDYLTGKIISNKASFIANIQLFEPPHLLTPTNSSVIKPSNPQFITFQWLLQQVDPLSTQYQLNLFEIMNNTDNIETAVTNGKAHLIYQSSPVNYTSFLYDANAIGLKEGNYYAWYIQAKHNGGKTICKNNGISPIYTFHYGYLTNGKIQLKHPSNDFSFSLRDPKLFHWSAPDNLINGQSFYYKLSVYENDSIFTLGDSNLIYEKTSPTQLNANDWKEIQSELSLKPNATYFWQVKAYSEQKEIAKSDIYTFTGPPCIEAFKAGNHIVYVDRTSNCDLNSLCGKGKVVFSDKKEMQTVNFKNISIEKRGVEYIMSQGTCVSNLKNYKKELTNEINNYEKAYFIADSIILTVETLTLKGYLEYQFPQPTQNDSLLILRTKTKAINYNNYYLLGSLEFEDDYFFKLLIPTNFELKFNKSSTVYVKANDKFSFKLNGIININGKQNSLQLGFNNQRDIYRLYGVKEGGNECIEITRDIGISICPMEYTLHLTDYNKQENSSTQLNISKFNLLFNKETDKSGQLKFTHDIYREYSENKGDSALINASGLWMKVLFNGGDSTTCFFKSFPANLEQGNLIFRNGSFHESYLKGSIGIPLISETERFNFTLNFNEQGFNNGELDNSLKERTFQFNKDGEDQRINFKILDATFRYNRYIELLVDMDWPALSTKLESVNGLQLYGNYDIGFGSPGGSLSLPNRVLGNAYNYNITSKAIGASRECNIYGFGLAVDIVLGDDIASTKGSSGTNIYSVCENKMLLCNKPSNNLNNINNKETIESIDYNANNINTNVLENHITDSLLSDLNHAYTDSNLIKEEVELQKAKLIQSIESFDLNLTLESNELKETTAHEILTNKLSTERKEELTIRTKYFIKNNTQFISKTYDKLLEPPIKIIYTGRDEIINIVNEGIETMMNEVKTVLIDNCETYSVAIKVIEVCDSIKQSLQEQMSVRITNYVEEQIIYDIKYAPLDALYNALATETADILEIALLNGLNGVADINILNTLSDAGNLFIKNLFPKNLSQRLKDKGKALIDEFDPEDILISVLNDCKDEVIALAITMAAEKLGEKAMTEINNFIEDNADFAGIALAQADNYITLDFSNMGSKIKNGELDKVVRFDKTSVVITSPMVDISGYAHFVDDKIYGHSWQSNLEISIKNVPNSFTTQAKYISGNGTDNNKFWLAQYTKKGLNKGMTIMPLTVINTEGVLYHKIKCNNNDTTPFNLAPDVDYGASINLLTGDRLTAGKLMTMDLRFNAEKTKSSYTSTLNGKLFVGVTLADGLVQQAIMQGEGNINYSSSTNIWQGDFSLKTTENKYLCAEGQFYMYLDKDKSDLYMGTITNPISIKLRCYDDISFKGYIMLSNKNIILNLNANAKVTAKSGWLELKACKIRAWSGFDYAFATQTNLIWDPILTIPSFSIDIKAKNEIGVEVKTLTGINNITIAGVELSGNTKLSTSPTYSLNGSLNGSAEICNAKAKFDFDVSGELKK